MSVKIKTLLAPGDDLSNLDPGLYVSSMEYYECDESITEEDREGLADFLHFIAYLSLNNNSSKWADSIIPINTTAFRAVESHFSHIDGWCEIQQSNGVNYKSLVSFLMPHYKPGATRA